MRKVKLYAQMLTAAIVALAALIFGALSFLMMIVGDCGVTVFDAPDWPLQLFIALAVPAASVYAAVKVWRYCSGRLPFSSLR